jgi:hypothetical protein
MHHTLTHHSRVTRSAAGHTRRLRMPPDAHLAALHSCCSAMLAPRNSDSHPNRRRGVLRQQPHRLALHNTVSPGSANNDRALRSRHMHGQTDGITPQPLQRHPCPCDARTRGRVWGQPTQPPHPPAPPTPPKHTHTHSHTHTHTHTHTQPAPAASPATRPTRRPRAHVSCMHSHDVPAQQHRRGPHQPPSCVRLGRARRQQRTHEGHTRLVLPHPNTGPSHNVRTPHTSHCPRDHQATAANAPRSSPHCAPSHSAPVSASGCRSYAPPLALAPAAAAAAVAGAPQLLRCYAATPSPRDPTSCCCCCCAVLHTHAWLCASSCCCCCWRCCCSSGLGRLCLVLVLCAAGQAGAQQARGWRPRGLECHRCCNGRPCTPCCCVVRCRGRHSQWPGGSHTT